MILNETPVRTSKNFNINNIEIKNMKFPKKILEFNNVNIINDTSKISINQDIKEEKLRYGLGDEFENFVKENANQKIKVEIDSKINKEIEIDFKLDDNNKNLVENIEVTANEGSKGTVIIKYNSANEVIEGFHNGIIRVTAKKDSNINVIIANLMNDVSNNFLSIENVLEENANVNYTLVDFGGKNSITNYYSDLIGDNSKNLINTIYLGKENMLLDLNYIGELRGKKSDINIEIQGALKDFARKHFKGTIDFKRGAKKATGNENESCMLLSDTSRSLALPMLLCSEEDVEGNHSCSSGKVGEKELFYIMSRGFDVKSAIKLIVRAKFNKILENIKNEALKNEINYRIDNF